MKTSDFDYYLPAERIAQVPIEPRDASRLLVVHRNSGRLEHRMFRNVVDYLEPGDQLVGNDSRVIPARLFGHKPTGGRVEILLLHPLADGNWQCLVRGKGLRPGVTILIETPKASEAAITGTIVAETDSGSRVVRFSPAVGEWLHEAGQVPLPPYIHQELDDPERYQTVYSRIEGSVASSTAGLHFTPDLLVALRRQGIGLAFITLHIGLDTFQPVRTERVEDHPMHSEWATLSADVARRVNEATLAGGRIVAVGTTAVRSLEWGATGAQGLDPYDVDACPWRRVAAFEGETNLFIRPGYRFRAVDAMISNFHLPRSTLLMLVSAFAGKDLIDHTYQEAIKEGYRFYSFGDAMLIL
ncbi:MAG: tRNA preQ1(34) S-adenosylmethionine ribosyltransferase-isomerase QueA [Chloroflexota bacterium]|nr:tRNA preQ1(34) S-adenosylmethionine ribosyltransferase-isomerase QueA [Chloroflexota bacterium]